ncbi:MAG: alkaline phosphatase D family protein [Salibacteraceae bacterium]
MPVVSSPDYAYSARLVAANLEPGTEYAYRIRANDTVITTGMDLTFHTQPLWQFRTDPPAVRFAVGSCAYINEPRFDRPGKPYGGGYEIFDALASRQPDFMLWLGDNIYLREPDWSSRSGYVHRYSHTRSIPELQRLLQQTHHYAIWDDHDFGPNDANGSWVNKAIALDVFNAFWPNPQGVEELPGITTAFTYGDADFFLLDNRYERSAPDIQHSPAQILGRKQIDWLLNALAYSRAPFKFVVVGGQILNPAAVYENHAVYAEEREYLINSIAEAGITGVVFLTGDRHHTELSHYQHENGVEMYDVTVSPLTSSPHSPDDEKNPLRVDETLVVQRNFAILEITGKRKERLLNITVYDEKGNTCWTKQISAAKH